MRKVFEIGGFVAAAVLIAFGIGAIVLGVNGRSTVHDTLTLEQITGSPDMSPAAIAAEAKQAGLHATASFPRSTSPESRSNRRCGPARSPGYMRIHALESKGGHDVCPDASVCDR